MTLERFLATVYVNEAARRRFLADPVAEATRAGLNGADAARLAAVDREGIELAAASFARKRSGKRRSSCWWQRLLGSTSSEWP